jgi:hypothetical protein
MRTILVVLSAKAVEAPLLALPVLGWRTRRSAFNVRCKRSCRPFCCGLPGTIRSGCCAAMRHAALLNR